VKNNRQQTFLIYVIFAICYPNSLIYHSPYFDQPYSSSSQFLRTLEYKSHSLPQIASNGGEYSNYSLSIVFYDTLFSVSGNLTVDYYNNDPINITRIPFHLFLSGMLYNTRPGNILVLDVTTAEEPITSLSYAVNHTAQLLWVDLESMLEPYQRVSFIISFIATIPDGGFDRANSHGSDSTNSSIFKFTSFYPMVCVYDQYDDWNTDPYIGACDPFYHDMAYYTLTIEAHNNFIIVGSGNLLEKTVGGSSTVYTFDSEFPVREVTFAASKYYIVESAISNGVNVSTYYLPKSYSIWQTKALNSALNALSLFNDTFGPYPYSNLNIVEEYASTYLGMEYPIQVYASEIIDHYSYPLSVKRQILEKVVVHEVAHQWWYNMIGFDQIDWGFLDEGLTCWSTDYFGEVFHSDWEYFQFDKYFDVVRMYFSNNGLPSKINQSAYEILAHGYDYSFISYRKSPLIFEKVRRILGDTIFIQGLKTFYDEFYNKIGMLTNLQNIFETIVNQSLNWLFFPLFNNDYLPKYDISECIYDYQEKVLNITINDLNEGLNTYIYSQQVPITVYDSEGPIIHSDWNWINGTCSLSIPITLSLPKKVRLTYGDDVLVQLDSLSQLYIEENVILINYPKKINGYTILLIASVVFISISYLIVKLGMKLRRYYSF